MVLRPVAPPSSSISMLGSDHRHNHAHFSNKFPIAHTTQTGPASPRGFYPPCVKPPRQREPMGLKFDGINAKHQSMVHEVSYINTNKIGKHVSQWFITGTSTYFTQATPVFTWLFYDHYPTDMKSGLVYPNSLVPINMCSDCETGGVLNHCK